MTRHRILHVFRTPVGGLFRHVLDISSGQAERGHEVGIVCDSSTGGERAEAMLSAIAPHLSLGLTRLAMRRLPHPADLGAIARLRGIVRRLGPDVLHGHGSKGGLFARFVPAPGAIRAYTPHGGSFNYGPGTLSHHLYMGVERLLVRRTDVFLFESASVKERFDTYVGATDRPIRVVRNGIAPDELLPVATDPDPFDLLYIGELRALKGIDTLIEAVSLIRREHNVALRLLIVGAGPDEASLHADVQAAGIADSTLFQPPQPIRAALAKARVMVVPSRAESFPYVVLEAAGAGQPLVSTNVGGIPEIFGPHAQDLIAPGNAIVMAQTIWRKLQESPTERAAKAQALSAYIGSHFSLRQMVDGVLEGYQAGAQSRLSRSH